jgi:hypothetical protein
MKRIVQIDGSNGVIKITGNPQESILYLKDKPIQYSWFAEVGSTWRYHIAQGLNQQAVEVNKGIEGLLKRGVQNEGDFLAVTEYFISFLSDGSYEFGYYELSEDTNWIEIPEDENYTCFDYYGGCLDISPTQNSIDENKVEEYRQAILKGMRPSIILIHVQNSCMFFILDGHHKFCAYGSAKLKPHAIIITKIGNEYKSLDETIELANSMNCYKREYIKWMESEKGNLDYYKDRKLNLEETFRRITK